MNRPRPAVFFLVFEPGFDSLCLGRRRRVPDPASELSDTSGPLVHGVLEPLGESSKLHGGAFLSFAAIRVVPQSGHPNEPEPRDRHTHEGEHTSGVASSLDVDFFPASQNGSEPPLALPEFGEQLVEFVTDRAGPGTEDLRVR